MVISIPLLLALCTKKPHTAFRLETSEGRNLGPTGRHPQLLVLLLIRLLLLIVLLFPQSQTHSHVVPFPWEPAFLRTTKLSKRRPVKSLPMFPCETHLKQFLHAAFKTYFE